jgi:hypothetical protein
MDYYWTAYQTEWATDLLFETPTALADVYPALVRHAMLHFKSPDVMRFLGGKVNGNFLGEIVSSFKDRPEGARVKHWAAGNSVKMYDKAGSILRVETTIGRARSFKVYRPAHDNPDGKAEWKPMRQGVADLHRRAEVSQRCNERYLDALAVVDNPVRCGQVFDSVARHVMYNGRRVRALRTGDPDDIALLQAAARGEFATSGFRNQDIRELLHPGSAKRSTEDRRRLAAKTSRQLRLLRAHGLIRKVPKANRYHLTERGRLLAATLYAAREATVTQLLRNAA